MSRRLADAAVVAAAATLAMPMFIGMVVIVTRLLARSAVIAPMAVAIWTLAAAYLAARTLGRSDAGKSIE